jgi:hypothetical protein
MNDGPFRLSRSNLADIESELGCQLKKPTRFMIEMWLGRYRDRLRVTPGTVKEWAAEDSELITTAERLLQLMRNASPEDYREGSKSVLYEALAERIITWKQRKQSGLTWERPLSEYSELISTSRPAFRPKNVALLEMLDRVTSCLDDGGLEIWRTWHRDGPRVRALRVILQIANRIDGKPAGEGSMRQIEELKALRRKNKRFYSDKPKVTKVQRQRRTSVT